MRLKELLNFNPIIVQCHDNPDADAIASGYAVYKYFLDAGKDVCFVYAGVNELQKANLKLMIDYLGIGDTLKYVKNVDDFLYTYKDVYTESPVFPGLVVTVDCQYGAGNVTKIPSTDMAIIDHHQIEITDVKLSEIMPGLGSCSTLVWNMLKQEGIEVEDTKLGTALYYGLYTDTNSFSEIANPMDMDLRDSIPFEKTTIHTLKNSNFSLAELDIAGVAMIRHIYNPIHKYAIIKAEQCDPNILGLISDFLLQVAEVHTCVVFNEWPNGFKFSTRSCVKEVYADEMASYLAEGIGSGGGHHEKAGGFINKTLYEKEYPTLHPEAYFSDKLNEYFDNCEVISAKEYDVDVSDMKLYAKKKIPLGYVMATDVFPAGTPATIRTLEGDFDFTIEDDIVIKIGIKGEAYPSKLAKLHESYEVTDMPFSMEDGVVIPKYKPTLRNRLDGKSAELMQYAKICIANGETFIYAKQLDRRVKIFTPWDTEKYMLGLPGDYFAVRHNDLHDMYIVEREIFGITYEEAK